MSWFTRQTHKVAARVAASTDGEVWRRVQDDYAIRYVRRRGVRFPDMDALGAVLEQFTNRSGEAVSARAVGGKVNFFEPVDVAERVALLPAPADRASVDFTGNRPSGRPESADPGGTVLPSWTVTLKSTPGSSIALSELSKEGREFCEVLIEIIERHVVDAPRGSTETSAVVEPISLEEASQRAHDEKVTSKAARIGGRWGLAGGVIGGALSGWLAAVLTKAG